MYNWNPIHVDDTGRYLIRGSRSNDSVEWPLRLKKASVIMVNDKFDWMDRFILRDWQSLLLATMALASKHTFITITSEYKNLISMLGQIDAIPRRTVAIPADHAYLRANMTTHTEMGQQLVKKAGGDVWRTRADVKIAQFPPRKSDLTPFQEYGQVPWPPSNVIFGIRIDSPEQADTMTPLYYNMKMQWNRICTAAYAPGLDLDWEKIGLAELVDYIWTESGEFPLEEVGV